MDIYRYRAEMHWEPGVAMEFATFRYDRTYQEKKAGAATFAEVFEAFKPTRECKVGYQNNVDYFGPFRKSRLTPNQFADLAFEHLFNEVRTFLGEVERQNGFRFHDVELLVDKLAFGTRLIPEDATRLFYFTPSFAKRPFPNNTDVTLIEEPTLFDYFFSAFGFNQETLYLFSIWYD